MPAERAGWTARLPRVPVGLALVVIGSLATRVYGLQAPCSHPCRSRNADLIFDERYYVNAARVILRLSVPAGAPYSGAPPGSDPNSEHPPLAKLMIAGGMSLFGDRPLGWRFASLVMGTVALLAIYALVRAAGGRRGLATAAAGVMALDNLAMVHGRIATLDMPAVALMLVAAALYLSGRQLWAGLTLGVGGCMKLVSGYLLLVLLLLEALRVYRDWRTERQPPGLASGSAPPAGEERNGRPVTRAAMVGLRRLAVTTGVAVVTYLVLLSALDAVVRPYDPNAHRYLPNAFSHTWHMIRFAAAERSPSGPRGIASYPWEWLYNSKQIDYYTVVTTVSAGGTVISRHTTIAFRGAINPYLAFVMVPAVAAAAARAVSRERGDEVAAVGACWSIGVFVPLLIASVADARTSYLYYMLLVLPGVYLAAADLFARSRVPRAAALGWAAVLVAGFVAQYPIRTPSW